MKQDDILLATLPLFHSFAQTVVQNAGFFVGGTVVLLPRFDPTAALTLMQEHSVTIFAGVPTMYFALLNNPKAEEYNLSALRFCVSGGSPMPVEVMTSFDAKYNVNILEGYGLSETSPVASFNSLARPKKAGSIGCPIDYVEFRLVDKQGNPITETDTGETKGEIQIKGVNVMKVCSKQSWCLRCTHVFNSFSIVVYTSIGIPQEEGSWYHDRWMVSTLFRYQALPNDS